LRVRTFSFSVLSFEENEIPVTSIFVGVTLFTSDIIVVLLFRRKFFFNLIFFPLSSKFLESIMILIILTNSKKCLKKNEAVPRPFAQKINNENHKNI